jgi:methionyl-tRNA formyltransferase
MLRVVFFGTPAFAVPTLDALLESRHQVIGVVTQPDRPSGRGQRITAPPVKLRAESVGVPVWQPDRLKDESMLRTLRDVAPDIGVVAAYGKILPQVVLDIPREGLLNVHASLLPKYRGAAPIQRAVMDGETETGVTIMRVVLALDAGPMLAHGIHPIGPDETSEQVEHALASVGAGLLVATLDALEAGTAVEELQDDGRATYAPRLTKEDGLLDWRLAAIAVHNHVRGLHPWPHAFSMLDGSRLVILRGQVEPDQARDARDARGPADTGRHPGTIVEARGDRLVVAAGGGTRYRLLDVQPEGRRAMTAREFLAGHHVEVGGRFSSS